MLASRRIAVFAAVVLAVSASAAFAADKPGKVIPPPFEPKSPAAARALELQTQAIDLINKASRHVYATRPSCRPKLPRMTSSTTHDVPSQEILDAIAPLRDPAAPADANAAATPKHGPGEIYIDYTRTVRAANGTRLTIVVARNIRPLYRPTKRCLDAQHAQLVKLTADQPQPVRSLALREFGKIRQGQQQNTAQPTEPRDGIYLFTKNGGGGGGGIEDFLQRGNFGSSGGGPNGKNRSTLNGVVPDGVATVTLEYPKTVSRGPYYKPTVYPSAYKRTVRVQHNVLSVQIPRDAMDAFPPRMVWRNENGTVIHVAKQP